MKRSALILLLPVVLAAPSCERVRNVLKKGASAAAATASEGHVKTLPGDRYDEFVKQHGKLVVVDFTASWCGPCQQLAPALEKVAGEFAGTAVVAKVDVDEAKDLAAELGVRGIPEVRFFRDGKMVHRFSGAIPESELRKKFKTHAPGEAAAVAEGAPPAEAEPAPPEEAIQPMTKDWMPPGIERR